MKRAGGAFSVRFLRNGDTITITRDVTTAAGEGGALFQMIDVESLTVFPDWSAPGTTVAEKTNNDAQPIISIGVRSALGYPVEITGVVWRYEGTAIQFPTLTSSWQLATNSTKFAARINATTGKWELRIVDNIASDVIVSNRQLTYEVSYLSNGMGDTVSGSTDIFIQQGSAMGYTAIITTDRVELSGKQGDETYSAHLTVQAFYKASQITIDGTNYIISWQRDGENLTGSEDGITISSGGHTMLTVTREGIEGGSVFTAWLRKKTTPSSLISQIFVPVASDAQRLNDIDDEWQVKGEPTDAGANHVGPNHNASYNLYLYRNGVKQSNATIVWTWNIYNAIGEKKRTGSLNPVVITPADCECQFSSISEVFQSDVDVQVTADFDDRASTDVPTPSEQ